MILRDPVHGLVDFRGDAERVIGALLATREVQRLRRVRQLGLTSLVFPGAEHSRFSHAVGTAHVMQLLQARIREVHGSLPPEQRLDDEAARDGLAAALLHDLGHGPFSHLYEEVQPQARRHEAWTVDAIRDDATEVHRALETLSQGMAERVASMLEGNYRLGYLARSVSGMLDVDRADYLLRDSHLTGVRYGLYDLEWLLRAFSFGVVAGNPVLAVEGRKGLPPIEGFFLARHFMYQQVYHHKATRAAEALIRGLFTRLGELIRDGHSVDPLPPALRSAALGEPVALGDYLQLDDPALHSCFASWTHARDELLSSFARQLQTRRLPKTIPLRLEAEETFDEMLQRAREVVEASGVRSDLNVYLDVATDTPYEEPTGETPDGLWVIIRHRPIQRLGDASFLLRELRGKRIRHPRLIVPAAQRQAVVQALFDSESL
ncbi:MAG: HD domain-containing protein [Myxococcota bacterium]